MAQKAIAQTTCVLYDPADGSIVLMHTVVRFGGSKLAGRKAAEVEARSIVARRKQHRKELKALHVKADAVQPGVAYRVSRGRLTATP